MSDTPVEASAIEVTAEATQADRIEAKIDSLTAMLLEILNWKTAIEEAMAEIQSKGIMGIMGASGGLFGR